MAEPQITRRLAAILAADIVGYSSMMQGDETGTIAALRQIWVEIFNATVTARHGRIVKTMGDGALVEFGSVVDAVDCGIAIQRALRERNLAAERPVEFRIGISSVISLSKETIYSATGLISQLVWRGKRRKAAFSSLT